MDLFTRDDLKTLLAESQTGCVSIFMPTHPGRTAHEVKEVVPAAAEGHTETLFVARGRRCWGTFDPASGQVEEHAQEGPGAEDLLNLAAAHTLRHGRPVHALEPAQMPDRGPVAAIYRLPLPKRGKRP